MQLTPQVWSAVGVDADGDGTRDAADLDDAALGLAVLLCSLEEDLSTAAGQRVALSQHNADSGYLDLVLQLTAAYSAPVSVAARMISAEFVQPNAVRALPAKRSTRPAGAGSSHEAAPLPALAGTNFDAGTKQVDPPAEPPAPVPPTPEPPTPEPPTTEPSPAPPTPGTDMPTPGEPGTEPAPDDTCLAAEEPADEPTDEPTEDPSAEPDPEPMDEAGDEESECTPPDEDSEPTPTDEPTTDEPLPATTLP